MLAGAAVAVVAALHFAFLMLEMVLWRGPIGQKIFSMTAEQAETSAVLAANQGLYNGFISAGLLWGLFAAKRDVQIFFLICVVVAGVYGGWSAAPSIYVTQALPGAIALVLVASARARPNG
jgi:putative membrane protein